MKKPGGDLRLVTAALRGSLPNEANWISVLEIANRGWLGPALYLALERNGQLARVPGQVSDYLAFLHGRNRERNRRLRAQLIEAVGALNHAGIEPILLKGAIHLYTAPEDDLGARMLSDLDLSVSPSEMDRAKSALLGLDYAYANSTRELGRSCDVGVIELHDRPSPRSAHYLDGKLRPFTSPQARDGARARIPTATARALHLIVHDMIKEGDYWSLKIDLRHLHDLAELARSEEGIDWKQLGATLCDPPARRALALQALAMQDLFEIAIPSDLGSSRLASAKHVARLVGAGGGMAASSMRLAGNLSLGLHRLWNGFRSRGAWKISRQVYRRLAATGSGSRI